MKSEVVKDPVALENERQLKMCDISGEIGQLKMLLHDDYEMYHQITNQQQAIKKQHESLQKNLENLVKKMNPQIEKLSKLKQELENLNKQPVKEEK
jgi:peptidoglycan hydrolase CwlO-like protein